PVRREGLPFLSFMVVLPRENSWSQWDPSRSTSTVSLCDSAFTTETPTPCSPPEIRYPPPPNLPPAFSVVRTTSRAGRRSFDLGMGLTGIPRPLSSTVQEP